MHDQKGVGNNFKSAPNPYDFVPTAVADVDLGLDSELSGDESDGDFQEYNERVQAMRKQR